MAIKCPRCGRDVTRVAETINQSDVLSYLRPVYRCPWCGLVPIGEFPRAVRVRHALVFAAIVLTVLLATLLGKPSWLLP